jgi:hypothetical protein
MLSHEPINIIIPKAYAAGWKYTNGFLYLINIMIFQLAFVSSLSIIAMYCIYINIWSKEILDWWWVTWPQSMKAQNWEVLRC